MSTKLAAYNRIVFAILGTLALGTLLAVAGYVGYSAAREAWRDWRDSRATALEQAAPQQEIGLANLGEIAQSPPDSPDSLEPQVGNPIALPHSDKVLFPITVEQLERTRSGVAGTADPGKDGWASEDSWDRDGDKAIVNFIVHDRKTGKARLMLLDNAYVAAWERLDDGATAGPVRLLIKIEALAEDKTSVDESRQSIYLWDDASGELREIGPYAGSCDGGSTLKNMWCTTTWNLVDDRYQPATRTLYLRLQEEEDGPTTMWEVDVTGTGRGHALDFDRFLGKQPTKASSREE